MTDKRLITAIAELEYDREALLDACAMKHELAVQAITLLHRDQRQIQRLTMRIADLQRQIRMLMGNPDLSDRNEGDGERPDGE